jgi:hypothetical protein
MEMLVNAFPAVLIVVDDPYGLRNSLRMRLRGCLTPKNATS